MLALKSWDTNLRASEKKTLQSFLLLYAFLTLLIVLCAAIFYYLFQRDTLLQNQKEYLSTLSNEHIARLKQLHYRFDKDQTYPRDPRFESAIYDSALHEIFSTLHSSNVNLYEDSYLKEGKIYFIKELEFYYLGARYLALEVTAPPQWEHDVFQKLCLFGSLLFAILVLIGYGLLRLLLRPMREALALLDRFIKDTTHELNTPIHTILSNIEMLENEPLPEAMSKKIRRIRLASLNISSLYDDLTYLVLSHRCVSHNTILDLKALIEERLEYFSLLIDSKKISTHVDYRAEPTLVMDHKKLTKLIDNILSNAIKYNTLNGTITITLEAEELSIADSGKGMNHEQIQHAFERYTRFDNSVGGFGIGLSIVALIAKEYNLHVNLSSVENEGTIVRIAW